MRKYEIIETGFDRNRQGSKDSNPEKGGLVHVVRTLDCKGLSCPEPVLNVIDALIKLETGDVIVMYSTDPGSMPDMAAWAKRTGNRIVDQKQEDDVYTFYIEKK
ncbi:MAG: hypothetical protein IEMM0002_1018 [bacterium]|nr:MAG: hypothetical protein IEMM0002_1018 [bacterium]